MGILSCWPNCHSRSEQKLNCYLLLTHCSLAHQHYQRSLPCQSSHQGHSHKSGIVGGLLQCKLIQTAFRKRKSKLCEFSCIILAWQHVWGKNFAISTCSTTSLFVCSSVQLLITYPIPVIELYSHDFDEAQKDLLSHFVEMPLVGILLSDRLYWLCTKHFMVNYVHSY